MHIAHDLLRRFGRDGVADGVNKVSFTQTGTAIDKQWVVGNAGIVGHLDGSSPGQVVGFADNQVIEGERLKEPRFFVITILATRFFRA
ncbi:MAG: hypothetical protein ACD_10C00066G0001 [uncultured bacterium]|nr:MAG: hypothetical protein ACD_10C00066G0001 [uncultured bacterium]